MHIMFFVIFVLKSDENKYERLEMALESNTPQDLEETWIFFFFTTIFFSGNKQGRVGVPDAGESRFDGEKP